MKATTIKVSIETRDRLRSLGGETYEATIIAALDAMDAMDAMDAHDFWAQADAAATWRRSLSASDQAELAERDTTIDAAFEGIP